MFIESGNIIAGDQRRAFLDEHAPRVITMLMQGSPMNYRRMNPTAFAPPLSDLLFFTPSEQQTRKTIVKKVQIALEVQSFASSSNFVNSRDQMEAGVITRDEFHQIQEKTYALDRLVRKTDWNDNFAYEWYMQAKSAFEQVHQDFDLHVDTLDRELANLYSPYRVTEMYPLGGRMFLATNHEFDAVLMALGHFPDFYSNAGGVAVPVATRDLRLGLVRLKSVDVIDPDAHDMDTLKMTFDHADIRSKATHEAIHISTDRSKEPETHIINGVQITIVRHGFDIEILSKPNGSRIGVDDISPLPHFGMEEGATVFTEAHMTANCDFSIGLRLLEDRLKIAQADANTQQGFLNYRIAGLNTGLVTGQLGMEHFLASYSNADVGLWQEGLLSLDSDLAHAYLKSARQVSQDSMRRHTFGS